VKPIRREKRTLEIFDFWPEDYGAQAIQPQKIAFAPRVAPSGTSESWYAKAVKAGQPVWIEARTIRKGAETVAGVSYAAPFYGPEKELRGVTSVDFDIVAISKFLAANPVGKEGFAFIIEKPAKGSRASLPTRPGYPHHTVVNERGLPQYEFVPYRKLKDVRVAGFMEQLSRKDLLQPGKEIHIFSFSAGGTEYFGSYRKMTGKDMPDWVIASIIREKNHGVCRRNNLETLGIGLASFLLILLTSAWISGRISRPLKKISNESEAIGRFELEAGPSDTR